MDGIRCPRYLVGTVYFLLFASVSGLSQGESDKREIPVWFLEEIAMLTDGSGRWVADNAEYRSAQEPFDAYVTEWESSFGGVTMTGRLFGLRNGEESNNFWEFRQYWHPLRGEAVIEQFGMGGTVGLGTMWQDGAGTRSLQTFSGSDGSSSQAGHASVFTDQETLVTDSFDVTDGEWTTRRHYVWRRQRVATSP